jgi:hypothetical protein
MPHGVFGDLIRRECRGILFFSAECFGELSSIVRKDLGVVARARSGYVREGLVNQRTVPAVTGIDVNQDAIDRRALRRMGRHRVRMIDMFVGVQIPCHCLARVIERNRRVSSSIKLCDRSYVGC